MTRRRHYSPPPPHPSSMRRSKQSIDDGAVDDDPRTIPDIYNDYYDDNSESDDEPLRRPSRETMGMRPSKDSFMATLGKQVTATQLNTMSVQPLQSERREVFIFSEEEDDCEPVSLASKKLFHSAFG